MDSASHHQQGKKHSPTELFSSAKLVAEAAKGSFGSERDKVDKGRAAGAAADLLDAASEYGNLEGNKYVEKADNYLHQYHSSHSSNTMNSTSAESTHAPTKSSHSAGEDQSEGGGSGDYFKMAQGFLKTTDSTHAPTKSSHSAGEDQSEGGAPGDYFKMAQGFLNKN